MSQHQPHWRKALDSPPIAMVIALAVYAAATALGIVVGSLVPTFGFAAANSILKDAIVLLLLFAGYKLLIVRLGERPRDELRAVRSFPNLGKGIVAGFLIFSVVVGLAYLFGVYRVVGRGDASGVLVSLVSVALVPAFTEELLFRGILFRWIEEFAGSWVALIITAALFGLAHILNPGATWFSSFAIAVEAGLLLGAAYMLTRSLWMPIGLHAAWNFTEGPIFGVPVSGGPSAGLVRAHVAGPPLLSGGAFGLEASVIAMVVATAAGLWFLRLAVRRGELVRAPWAGHRN